MRDQVARDAIDALAREVAGIVIAIKTPAMHDSASYDRIILKLKEITEKLS